MNLVEYLSSNEVILLQEEAENWETAVKLGTDLLEKAGAISPAYYQGICDSVRQLGPYFLLAPGLAMPHARPGHGVLEDSFALVTLRTPVCFGDPDNDPVDILITMAVKDAKIQNEEAIVQIVELLDNEARVKMLKQAKSSEDIAKILASLRGG